MAAEFTPTEGYTCDSARRFDQALRRHDAVARRMFEAAQPYLAPGATYENVEFDTECRSERHVRDCRIRMITVRRRSNGPNGDDVFSLLPQVVFSNPAAASLIMQAHDAAFGVS